MDNATMFGIVVMGFFTSTAAYYGYKSGYLRRLERLFNRKKEED